MRRTLSLLALAVTSLAVACTPTTTSTGQALWKTYHLTGWQPVSTAKVDSLDSSQGLATVVRNGHTSLVYDNLGSIPTDKSDAGWTHIGDPDSRSGYIVYPYQAEDPANGKLYQVQTPTGQSYDYTHGLAPGEQYNNSFAAVSPDGQWLVSGEWDTMTRLLVFPMPILNAAVPAGGGSLSLSGQIDLSSPVNDIQGCTFTSPTRLLCSSDDSSRSLWPDDKPLLQVDLSAPLSGGSVTGTVTDLGALPQVSPCAGNGTFEAEGIDFDLARGALRVIVVPPGLCVTQSDVYEYIAGP